MSYIVNTASGAFKVLQQLTYGDMIIAGLLFLILLVISLKTLYDIADREGYI